MPRYLDTTRKIKKEKPPRKTANEFDLEIKEEKRIRKEKAYEEIRLKAAKAAERYIVPNVGQIISLVDKDHIIEHKDFDNYVEYKNIICSYEKTSYIDSPGCIKYIDIIKEQVESVFDITKVKSKDKSVDFVLRLNGMRFKVKHIVSSLRQCRHNNVDISQYCWSYHIKNNNVADAFLLTAIDNITSLNYQHLWFIQGQEMYKVLQVISNNGKRKLVTFSRKMFRHRFMCRIRNDQEIISYMDKFELKGELKKIRLLKLDDAYKDGDVIKSLLCEKQQEIFETKGIKRSIGYLVEEAIRIGFGKKLKLDDNTDMDNTSDVVQKMLDARLKKHEAKIFGSDLVDYENEAYNLVVEKQKELLEITGELKSIKEIMDEGIESGIFYVSE